MGLYFIFGGGFLVVVMDNDDFSCMIIFVIIVLLVFCFIFLFCNLIGVLINILINCDDQGIFNFDDDVFIIELQFEGINLFGIYNLVLFVGSIIFVGL